MRYPEPIDGYDRTPGKGFGHVWVPVAEYRPNSKAIVYEIDPVPYLIRERFRVVDHVGGVVRDRITGSIHGVSWGSRTLYSWTPAGRQLSRQPNNDHLIDSQPQ